MSTGTVSGVRTIISVVASAQTVDGDCGRVGQVQRRVFWGAIKAVMRGRNGG